jgi:hypothetical protein
MPLALTPVAAGIGASAALCGASATAVSATAPAGVTL